MNIRYDRIKIGKQGGRDLYDPFRLIQQRDPKKLGSLANSYLDETSPRVSYTDPIFISQ